jgi:enamine deaminase RidA (YjgF/YER057c/UK114 family)
VAYPELPRSLQFSRRHSGHFQGQFGEGDKHEYKPEGQSTYNARRTRAGRRRAAVERIGRPAPRAPEPFGTYVEAVQSGNLLFLSGMLPTEGHGAKFIGRVSAELDVEAGRKAAHLAALNALAVARQHLGPLDRVKRVVRFGVSVATSGDVREQPKVADAASELL